MQTPWGTADTIETLAEGITSVTTPSHGGIILSTERQAELPADIKNFLGSMENWEEDCDWAVPYYHFRDAIAAYGNAQHHDRNVEAALSTLKLCHPEYNIAADTAAMTKTERLLEARRCVAVLESIETLIAKDTPAGKDACYEIRYGVGRVVLGLFKYSNLKG